MNETRSLDEFLNDYLAAYESGLQNERIEKLVSGDPIMLKNIKVTGYKIIDETLELRDLSRINYLIGKNGSGKSSILELIMMVFNDSYYNLGENETAQIKNAFGNPRTVFKSDFKFECLAQLHGEEIKLEIDLYHNQFREGKAVLRRVKNKTWPGDIAHYFDCSNSRKTIPNKASFSLNLDDLDSFIDETELLKFINYNKYTDSEVSMVIRSVSPDESIQLLLDNGDKINLKSLSSGQLALISLYFNILKKVRDLKEYKKNTKKSVLEYFQIICIEEPENTLHPEFQKLIPKILNDLAEIENVIFFIATHSPFIISKSGDFSNTQKVYLISDGCTVDEKGVKGNGAEGFNDQSLNFIASQMVGADQTDFGYVENFCLLEEASLQILLDMLKKEKIIKNWGFISSGGNANVQELSSRIKELKNEQTLLKCNPFYVDKYCIIVDTLSTEELKNKTLVDAFTKLEELNKEGQQKRSHKLKETSLEDYYNGDVKEQFLKEIQGLKKKRKGAIKCKYAKTVAGKIINSSDPKAEFCRIFRGELDFLLKR